MSRTPRALALRIDRLSRHAHAFHRLAHHPMCSHYAGELVTLGARRVCRGCLAALIGFATGSSLGFYLNPHLNTELALGAAAAVLGLGSLALRLPKTIGRFLPAALASTAFVSPIHRVFTGDLSAATVVAGGLVLGICGLMTYRRRGPNRIACASCPERTRTVPCSGLAPIVRRERAFQRLSQRWLDAK